MGRDELGPANHRRLATGGPAGDPASPPRTDIPPAEEELPPRADLLIKAPQPYLPDTTTADDYQPVIKGQQQAPRDVHWGESTLDELCAIVLTASAAK